MRELERNKQLIYYALLNSTTEATDLAGYKTGELVKSYSAPAPYRINVSPARNNAERDAFGIDCAYSKTMSTADMDCPIKEDTLLWVGIQPSTSTVSAIPHNYYVVRKAESLNDIVYAIREVTLSG